jgi:5-methylcytosine-specific restriction endonuclease McrA
VAKKPWNGSRYRRLCAEVRRRNDPCCICGHQIDLTLDPRSPWSFTVEHTIPLSRGGSLLDPANARSAHRVCNSRKGNRVSSASVGKSSRRW